MEILINILTVVYAVELSIVTFLIGYTAKENAMTFLDPYDVAKMAKNINMDSDWVECYRAALVLKQAGLSITYIDDHRFAGRSAAGLRLESR